jgi:hypothetical protein
MPMTRLNKCHITMGHEVGVFGEAGIIRLASVQIEPGSAMKQGRLAEQDQRTKLVANLLMDVTMLKTP